MSEIQCPQCNHQFEVQEALSSQLERKYQDQLRIELDKEREASEERAALKLAEQRAKLGKQLEEQMAEQLSELQAENEKRRQENLRLKQEELSFKKREKELLEKEQELKLQVEQEILNREHEIAMKAKAQLQAEFEIERKKMQVQIEQSSKLAEEMKRKAEQGSMQLQGEAQELVLEDLLSEAYPFDRIEPVAKGVKGADCLQSVINASQKLCGTIIYESKNTKDWNDDWLKKLKVDQASARADIAVIVSKALPKGQSSFNLCDGVWVCSLTEVRALSLVLRESLLKMAAVKIAQDNIGDKKSLLYEYFTGNQFAQRVQALLDNFAEQAAQLNKEKVATEKLWKKRETQIWAMQQNLAGMFGSIEGIAGKEIPGVAQLELDTD